MEGRHYKDMSRAVESGVAAFLDHRRGRGGGSGSSIAELTILSSNATFSRISTYRNTPQ